MGNGLLRLNPETGEVKAYTLIEKARENRKINSITNDYLSQLSISPDGRRIYVATTMGVCALDLQTESWLSVFGKNCLNYGTPIRVAREFNGKLYIGTNDGLLSYDLKKHQLK